MTTPMVTIGRVWAGGHRVGSGRTSARSTRLQDGHLAREVMESLTAGSSRAYHHGARHLVVQGLLAGIDLAGIDAGQHEPKP